MIRIVSILLIVCYTLCAWNISISFHQCAGHIKYLSLNDSGHEKKCCKSKKAMPEGCCKSLKVSFKKTDDGTQNHFSISKKVFPSTYILPLKLSVAINTFVPVVTIQSHLWRPPPNRTSLAPLYILYSVFRI